MTWSLLLVTGVLLPQQQSRADDFVVYSIYRELDMGNPGETPLKDYYLNMGSSNGLHEGSRVDVIRKFSTYDSITEKLFREVQFKVATLKVIHVESGIAVARMDKMVPFEKNPAIAIKGVMLGDSVRISSDR
jgi:hypothetical protein